MITNEEKNIIDTLKKQIECDAIKLSQERFDILVDYIYKNEDGYKELLWRLCGSYEDSKLNFNKVIDIYVDTKDADYLAELINYVPDSLDYQYLVDKLIGLNDKEFYYNFRENFWPMIHDCIDYYYEKQLESFYNKED